MQDSNSRFTPNNGVIGEDVIGEVILGKDLNSFVANRYQQQMQQSYRPTVPNYQQHEIYDRGLDNIGIDRNSNIPNSNHVISSQYNQHNNQNTNESTEIVRVIKLRFEIDFQINLNVVNK
jgi:hypothetical protein